MLSVSYAAADDIGMAVALCSLLLLLAILLVSIWASFLRWVFRIDRIVANQEKILTELGRISRSDAGTQ